MYVIKNWDSVFENADTRKRVRLGWFHCPSGVESQGYIELMSYGTEGVKAFGVFMAICQWSATCLPVVRGSCARSDGRPLSPRQLAAQIRMPVEVVESALKVLTLPEIGWIYEEKSESATDVPVICQSSASHLPQGKGKGKGKGQGQGKGEGKGICTEPGEPASVPEFDPASCQFPVFPCSGDTKTWQATETQLAAWREAYPGIDVNAEHRKAHVWIMANLTRRKTAVGYAKFLTGWMARTQDSGGTGGAAKQQPKTFAQIKQENTDAAFERVFGSDTKTETDDSVVEGTVRRICG